LRRNDANMTAMSDQASVAPVPVIPEPVLPVPVLPVPMLPLPPFPRPSYYSAFFWEHAKRHELAIQRCDRCHKWQHWPAPVCRHCSSFDLSPSVVSGRGTLYTFTVAMQSFHPYFDPMIPLILAVVELVEQPGLKLVTNLFECTEADLSIGMDVEVLFQDVNEDLTLPQFRPARVSSSGAAGAMR
jgi:uncharacterized protein